MAPRSTTGQLVLLLSGALLASHLATVLVLRAYSDALNPAARDQVVEHLASAYQLALTASEEDIARLLPAMSSAGARFWIAPATDPPPSTPEALWQPGLRRLLAARLGARADAPQPRVRVEQSRGKGYRGILGLPAVRVHVAAPLPDGRWLHSEQLSRGERPWWWWLGLWLPVSALPVLLLLMIFLYRMLRPIKALAAAAEKVSRGERLGQLPVVGPAEVREVTAAFNSMQEKLTRFIDDRTRLLAAISHDVRTPITSLRVRTELVEDPRLRAQMTRTLDDMSAMVEQTLQFARDDAAGEPMQEMDLMGLLDEVALDAQAMGRDVEAQPGPPCPCRARPTSLRRALANLVDNAVRHGGEPVRMRLMRRPLCIEIDDAGPGLDPELLERVFEPFFQGDVARNRGDNASGVGLGLAIARSCARAHGGDVVLANRPEGGLRATLNLQ